MLRSGVEQGEEDDVRKRDEVAVESLRIILRPAKVAPSFGIIIVPPWP